MARVSYLKPAVTPRRAAPRASQRSASDARRPRRGRFIAGGMLVLVLAAAGAAALIFVSAKASLSADSNALAKIGMPLGGGTIQSVSVVTGPHSRPVPVELRGDQIWPKRLIPAHELLQVDVVIKRPGWIGWLAGKTQRLHLTLMTPSASLRQHYITLKPGQPLLLRFKQPVRVIAVANAAGQLERRVLAKPLSEIRLHRTADAGTPRSPRRCARGRPRRRRSVTWFPAGAAATALATPAPGSQIRRTRRSRSPSTSRSQRRSAASVRRCRRRPPEPGRPRTTTRSCSSRRTTATDSARRCRSRFPAASGWSAASRPEARARARGTSPQAPRFACKSCSRNSAICRSRSRVRQVAPTLQAQEAAAIKPPPGKLRLEIPQHPGCAAEHVVARASPGR